jgi:hypothetical protein
MSSEDPTRNRSILLVSGRFRLDFMHWIHPESKMQNEALEWFGKTVFARVARPAKLFKML